VISIANAVTAVVRIWLLDTTSAILMVATCLNKRCRSQVRRTRYQLSSSMERNGDESLEDWLHAKLLD
jgi:hypothetical protein